MARSGSSDLHCPRLRKSPLKCTRLKPIFVGTFSTDELRIMECIFDDAWSRISSTRHVRSETDQAQLQRARLAAIVTQMMKRREESIDELVAAACTRFKESESSER